MSQIRMWFKEMDREILDFYLFAKPFLDPTAEECLRGFAARLANIQASAALPGQPSRPYTWAITENLPLMTIPSRIYEDGKTIRSPEVTANLTSIWQITPDTKGSKKLEDLPKQFSLTGNASVRVQWVDTSSHKTIGEWTADVGDVKAPGCMFHTQFPNGVPVPRHPCIAFTPMAVAEHVLGELFQTKWQNHSLTHSPQMESWASIQKQRLKKLFAWHWDVIKDCEGPPWTALKTERIPADRFVAD